MIEVLNRNEKPEWLIYPQEYLDLIKNNKDGLLPWYLMNKEQILIRYRGLMTRYPKRELFPFARDDSSDDIACWERNKPEKVILIHDFASPGYENKLEFETFDKWYLYITNSC